MKQDTKIDEFARFTIKEMGVASPSDDFVDQVMKRVKIENSEVPEKIYVPLISKTMWVLLSMGIIGLLILLMNSGDKDPALSLNFSFDFIQKYGSLNLFEHIKFSKLVTYCMVLFSIFMGFQLLFIKNLHNKKYLN